MRIVLFSQFFPPELVAAAVRAHAFAAGLAAAGHDVEVICELPNHPYGTVSPEYRGRLFRRRRIDGIHAYYVSVLARPVKTTATRVALYGSYAAMAAVVGTARPRPDVVFASSPPLPVGAAAAAVAARHRVPWVLDVRDLWPEAAVALGQLSDPRLLALAERLELRLYRSAAAITTVTEPFRAAIAQRARCPDKVSLLPNGTTRLWLNAASSEPERPPLDLPQDAFLWTYAGNVGLAQGLETAIDAARALGAGFTLLVLGDGPQRAALERRAARLPSGTVVFRALVAPERAARHLRASDALLVPLRADAALATFVPSKLYDCCAVGRPVIVAANGEARRIAVGAGAALGVDPGDPAALASAVRRLRDEPALAARLGRAGHAFAAEQLREHQVLRLERLLVRVAARGRAAR